MPSTLLGSCHIALDIGLFIKYTEFFQITKVILHSIKLNTIFVHKPIILSIDFFKFLHVVIHPIVVRYDFGKPRES